MKAINKILLVFYYLIWTVFLAILYSILTERFYQFGYILAPFFGVLTALITVLTLLSLTAFYYLRIEKRALNIKFIKLTIIPVFFLIPFFITIALPRQLENKIKKIKVTHITYGCECADWKIIQVDGQKQKNGEDIYLEPIKKKLILPDTIGYHGDILELTGQFYLKKGFPKGFFSFQYPDKARVFRYDKFKVIKSNHFDSNLEKDN